MPLYLIERNLAEALEHGVTPDAEREIKAVNAEVGVEWLYSFLSADKKKTMCIYEADSPDDLREAARRLGLPADVIIEVTELRPGLTA